MNKEDTWEVNQTELQNEKSNTSVIIVVAGRIKVFSCFNHGARVHKIKELSVFTVFSHKWRPINYSFFLFVIIIPASLVSMYKIQ